MLCSFPSLVAASVHGALPVHYCVKHWRDRIRLSLPVVPASLPLNLLHHPLSAANPQTKARDPTGPRLTNNRINSSTTAPVSLIFVSILVEYTRSFNHPELFFNNGVFYFPVSHNIPFYITSQQLFIYFFIYVFLYLFPSSIHQKFSVCDIFLLNVFCNTFVGTLHNFGCCCVAFLANVNHITTSVFLRMSHQFEQYFFHLPILLKQVTFKSIYDPSDLTCFSFNLFSSLSFQ